MKYRRDFVTNSSSSSFIFTNKTCGQINGKGIAFELKHLFEERQKESFWYDLSEYTFEDFIEATLEVIPILDAYESLTVECSDDLSNLFEFVIHSSIDYLDRCEFTDFDIEFGESHH